MKYYNEWLLNEIYTMEINDTDYSNLKLNTSQEKNLEEIKNPNERKFRTLVIKIASEWAGKKIKETNNKDFNNPEFIKFLTKYGGLDINKGLPWCGYFVRAVARKAYNDLYKKDNDKLDKLLQASSQGLLAFAKSNDLIEDNPQIGYICVWQHAKNPDNGHMSFIHDTVNGNISDVGGNTYNPETREDGSVFIKQRKLVVGEVKGDLKFMGYVKYPEDIFPKVDNKEVIA